MTFDPNPSRNGDLPSGRWTPPGLRHGERTGAGETGHSTQEREDEPIFPPIAPPPIWPRVFPGI